MIKTILLVANENMPQTQVVRSFFRTVGITVLELTEALATQPLPIELMPRVGIKGYNGKINCDLTIGLYSKKNMPEFYDTDFDISFDTQTSNMEAVDMILDCVNSRGYFTKRQYREYKAIEEIFFRTNYLEADIFSNFSTPTEDTKKLVGDGYRQFLNGLRQNDQWETNPYLIYSVVDTCIRISRYDKIHKGHPAFLTPRIVECAEKIAKCSDKSLSDLSKALIAKAHLLTPSVAVADEVLLSAEERDYPSIDWLLQHLICAEKMGEGRAAMQAKRYISAFPYDFKGWLALSNAIKSMEGPVDSACMAAWCSCGLLRAKPLEILNWPELRTLILQHFSCAKIYEAQQDWRTIKQYDSAIDLLDYISSYRANVNYYKQLGIDANLLNENFHMCAEEFEETTGEEIRDKRRCFVNRIR